MGDSTKWSEGLTAAVTVTDARGTILEMNERSRATFAKDGGGALIGRSVFDCHPARARPKIERLYAEQAPNHYTIRKKGQKKIVHQLPWYENGAFAGFVEISVVIPDEIAHFDRDAPAKKSE